MPKINFWNKVVTRFESDQRAREGRLQLERLEQLLVNKRPPNHRQALWLLRPPKFYLLLDDRRPFANGPRGMGVKSRQRTPRDPQNQPAARSRVRNRSQTASRRFNVGFDGL